MKKCRILSLFLCIALVFSIAALSGCNNSSSEVHDHDHDHDVVETVEPTREVTDIDHNDVPLTSGGTCATWSDHSWSIQNVVINDYCGWQGGANVQRHRCTKCGLTYDTAIRANGSGNVKFNQHNYTNETTVASECSNNPFKVKKCVNCGTLTIESQGGHKWSSWQTVSGGGQCQAETQKRTCVCGAEETRTVGGGHTWKTTETPATCEKPAKTTKLCTVCGAVEETEHGVALGHNFFSETDCTQPRKCTRCGETIPGGQHVYGSGWVTTASGHKRVCQVCKIATSEDPHVLDAATGKCSVCGYQMKAGPVKCSHQWGSPTRVSAFTHQETCSLCGATRSVPCTQSTFYTPRTDCTKPEYCQCGNVRRTAQAKHNFGTWICSDSSHQHQCLNAGCTYGSQAEGHTYVTTAGGVKKCSTCDWTDKASLASHSHVWGVWTSNGAGGHSHSCTVSGCTAKESADHRLSAADCKGSAICLDCGAAVTTAPGSTHTGGTEIRGAKAAAVGADGYTGDTYCLGCGKKLSSGTAIPALTANHTHSYASVWEADGAQHWQACSCGDRLNEAAHTFKNGKCTVCGAADPSYATPAGEHVHSWSAEYSTDASSHWRVCTTCGEITEKGQHIVVTEENVQRCEVCGLTLGEIEKEADQVLYASAAAEKFSDIQVADYYSSSVGWAVKNNITKGTGGSSFSPTAQCTEAQILTMLYRAAGSPAISGSAAEGWSGDMGAALTWAAENGLLDDSFDPNAVCTRSSAVTYMWRAAGSPEAGDANFSDVDAGDQAVAWAVENGITGGTGGNKFSPDAKCTRSQIVTLLYREATEAL